MDLNFIFMDCNAPPHRENLVEEYHESEAVNQNRGL